MRGRGRARYREQNSPSPSHRPGSDDRWTHASYQSDSTPPVQSQYSHGDCQQRDSPVQSSFSKSTRMPVDGFSPYNAESTSTSTRGASSHVKKQDRCRNRRPDVQVYVPRARRSQGGSDQHAAETSESPLPRSHRQHGATERNHRESEPSSVATVPGQVSTEQHMSESNRPSLAVSKSSPQKSKQRKVDMKRYVPRLPRCSQRNKDKTSDTVTALVDSSGPIVDEKKFSDTGKLGNDDTHASDNAHIDPISREDPDMETNQDILGHKMETFDNERKSELRNAECASYEKMPTELSKQGEKQNSENNMKNDSHNHFATNSMSTSSSIKSHHTCPDPRSKHKEIITEVYTSHQTNTDQPFCDNSKQSENDYIEQIENCDNNMDQKQFIPIVSSDKSEDTAENQIKAEIVDKIVDKNIPVVNTDINESKDKNKDVSDQISDNHEDNQVSTVTVNECNEQKDLTHDSNIDTGNSGNEFMHTKVNDNCAAFGDQTVGCVIAAERELHDKIETDLCNEINEISDTIGGKLPNMVGAEILELEKSEIQTNMEDCEDDKDDTAASILEDFSNITPEKKVNNSENIGYETNNCAENINCVARTNCDIMDNGDNDRVNNESPDQIIDIKSIDVNDTELKQAKDINIEGSYKSKDAVDQSVSITSPEMVDSSDLTKDDIRVDQFEVSEIVMSRPTPLEEDLDTDSDSENEDGTEQMETGKESTNESHVESNSSETKSVTKNSHQSLTEEVDEDSWDAMFDDDGECLDPNALNELTKTVGKVKIKKSKKINYLDYQPKDKTDFDFAQYEHIIEIYDFPAEFVTRDLIMAFQSFMSRGFDLKWVDDTHALGIFNSAIAAQDALGMVHPLLKVCPLSQASRQSKIKAKRCTEFLQPYKPRPETSAAAARRLVAGALGLATNVSREKREKERQQLKEAKAKRRKDRQNREDIWEFGKCAMDDES